MRFPPNSGTDFGISIALGILGPIIFFVFWYRPLYRAVQRDRSMSYFLFLFCFGFHVIFSIVMTIGIPNSGSAYEHNYIWNGKGNM